MEEYIVCRSCLIGIGTAEEWEGDCDYCPKCFSGASLAVVSPDEYVLYSEYVRPGTYTKKEGGNDEFTFDGNAEIWERLGAKLAAKGVYRPGEGAKFDEGKLLLGLIPPEAIIALGEVLTYGAKKYGKRNWEKGFDHSRTVDAALRHLYAYLGGEDIDPESKLHHLKHFLCNAAFLVTFVERGIGTDDRWMQGRRDE